MFSGPMPRMSTWRLLPRAPLALLPVRLTPGSRRIRSDRSLVGGRRAISSAVMTETPSDSLISSSAVPSTCTVAICCTCDGSWIWVAVCAMARPDAASRTDALA
ncbi:Uncharacterised protein [Bordetella pertussis]|nr:Uncharacterised protein [Bordetella pertussis]